MHKYIAFDLEITKSIPEGTDDWHSIRPLGISCAATYDSDGVSKTWCGREGEDGRFLDQMPESACRRMAEYLIQRQSEGYQVVTFNGLSFDFDVLAEECGDYLDTKAKIANLALNHIDIAFAMFCEKGFMCGLSAAAKGMGLAGKTEGMSGKMAPIMWAEDREQQEKVLEYVAQDAKVTALVYDTILLTGRLSWISRSGRRNRWYPTAMSTCSMASTSSKNGKTSIATSSSSGTSIRTVREALALPEPDNSWMDNPWKRSKFYGWMGFFWNKQRSSSDIAIAALEEQVLEQ